MNSLVLSVFPGIGLLDKAFEQEGYCVVRGPDLIFGGDVKLFHPPARVFSGIIGGPPCQAHSQQGLTAKAAGQTVAPDLIPEFCRVVKEAQPDWFLMENVKGAPLPEVSGYIVTACLLNNRECPDPPNGDMGAQQRRVRRFSFGTRKGPAINLGNLIQRASAANPITKPTVTASASEWRDGRAYGNHSRAKLLEMIADQGLPESFTLPAFTVREAIRAVGNGVPLPMGRAVAAAVTRATRS
jgi:DNA (cytosine-5)-methyltransferase 1